MRISLSLAASVVAICAMAAPHSQGSSQYYEVNRVDSRAAHFDYRPGEVIVKLKNSGNTPVRLRRSGSAVVSTSQNLNALLKKYGAVEAEALMPLTGTLTAPSRARAINGTEVEETDLSALYLVRLTNATIDLQSALNELRACGDVEFAEPNYKMYSLATGGSYTSDPLYSQQWGIAAVGADKLWEVDVTGKRRPVIAILDTGVDITHPDLSANIWTNTVEAEGAEGSDDDGNGYSDDIHGWDFVNNSGRMRDNNGHGTHCAGIAAACGGNGIGITGANPDALIMPITVLQSDGTGDVATLIKGLDYARANGADIISMSLGTYSNSIALRDALGKAYQKAVIVAAAGNDYRCIYPSLCPVNGMYGSPMYPAAYNFVLGVEASANPDGQLAGFSNYDCDGPILSTFADLSNYELRAPGTQVMSTFPGGQYRKLNGTSMACPLAAGAISRLMMAREISSKEELFGDLIFTSRGNLDIFKAYSLTDADRKPTLALVTYRIDDEKMGDGDGRPDAGETIRIYPTFRNAWGNARNIKYSIALTETEDPDILTFIDRGEAHSISNISSYATAEAENPFIITINPECVDGRKISMELTATCDNITDTLRVPITLTVENGIELGGILHEDMTLTPDKNYIVTSLLGIPSGVTLTLLPGTTLKFKENTGLSVTGHLIANGKPGKMITFTKDDLGQGDIYNIDFLYDTISYCRFIDLNYHQNPKWGYRIDNCVLNNLYGGPLFKFLKKLNRCNIYYTYAVDAEVNTTDYENRNYACNLIKNEWAFGLSGINYFYNSNIFNNSNANLQRNDLSWGLYSPSPYSYLPLHPNYHGTTDSLRARSRILDINFIGYDSFGEYRLDNMRRRAVHEAHGIVWKVVVNDYDAQDEYELLPPLGVGRHKFEVYFNRRMNQKVTPMLAMGVRSPYTQTAISEDGSWRTEVFDGDSVDIYTAWLEIKGKDNYDGVNTIYVAEAEDDEFFPIPTEDVRFHVNVQSAGSMSAGFAAEAGLGKVTLTWENPEENFDDLLGYNMYRYEVNEAGEASDTIRINDSLLTEESLTDFDVVPGHRYCYYYKVLRTNLQENSPSTTVAATPLTAAKGDADGSLGVDVNDVVTEVNYMLGLNPQPFIFDAADVNSDESIDVLDVVGTVNIIMHPKDASATMEEQSATYTIENGVLYLDTPVALGGVQFTFTAPEGTVVTPLDALQGMETTGGRISDSHYRFVAFSLSGRTLAPGRHALLSVGSAEVDEAILSDASGHKVLAIAGTVSGVTTVAMAQMEMPTPNPFNEYIDVPLLVGTPGNHDVTLRLTGLDGVTVLSRTIKCGYGAHSVRLDTRSVPAGFYLLSMTHDGLLTQTAKVIKR